VQDLKESGFEIFAWPLPDLTANGRSSNSKTGNFLDQIAIIPDELKICRKRATRPGGIYDLEEVVNVLSGYGKTVRRAFDVPLIFPDQISSLFKDSTSVDTGNGNGKKEEDEENDQMEGDKKEKGDQETRGRTKNEGKDKQVEPAITLDFFTLVTLQGEPAKVRDRTC
jgi:hypothetical protein